MPSFLDLDYRLGLKMSRTILAAAHLMLVFFTGAVLAIDAEAIFSRNCAQCHGATVCRSRLGGGGASQEAYLGHCRCRWTAAGHARRAQWSSLV